MSTSEHPETDGQTERANRVLEEILRGYVHSFTSWSEFLPMVEFAINNSVRASTSHTPFVVNGLLHPRLPALLESDSYIRGEGLARAKTVLALAHHVPTMMLPRMMPMSITSTSMKKKSRETAITQSPIQNQTLMTMLVYSASSTTIPARKMTPSLKKRTNS